MFLPNILFLNTLTEHFKRNYLADSQWYIEHVKSVVQMTEDDALFSTEPIQSIPRSWI